MNRSNRSLPVLALVAFAALVPWANGGADPEVQTVLFAASAVGATWLLSTQLRHRQRRLLPWPAVAAIGGVLLCLLHLLPIWSATPEATVPSAVALRVDLEGVAPADDLPTAEATKPSAASNTAASTTRSRVALTLDPHATEHTLAMLLLALTVFIGATWTLQSPERLHTAAWGLAGSGAALTLFAVLAKATWNAKLYWWIPLGHPQGVFGPIVYHNQAGGILLITLAAAVFLLTHAARGGFDKQPAHRGSRSRSTSAAAHTLPAPYWRRWLEPLPLMAILLVVLNGGGLLLTLSRGALLAALIATVITLAVVRPRTGWLGLGLVLGIAIAGAGASVFYFRMSEAVGRRYATLFESEQLLDNSRLAHWHDGFQAGQQHWLLGVGAGAYFHAHPLHQDEQIERTFLRAHNQYLETWVDSGLPGVLLLVLAIGSAGWTLTRLTRRRRSSFRNIAAWGLLVLVATAAHASVDYVLYLPATAIVFALVLGGVCGNAWQAERERRPGVGTTDEPLCSAVGIGLPPWAASLLTGLLAIGCLWSTTMGVRWHQEDAAVLSVPWGADQQTVDPLALEQAIARLETLVHHTSDYRVPLSLGELRITRFRQQAIAQLAEENELPASQASALWPWTAPLVLLQRAQELTDAGDLERVEQEIRNEPMVAERLGEARQAFLQARYLAPAAPQPHLRLGELSFLEPDVRRAAAHFEHAARLARGSTDLQFELGRRMLAAGDRTGGLAAWRRSLELDIRHWNSIYDVVGKQLSPQQINQWVLPDNPELLTLVAARQYTEPEQQADREALLKRVDAILRQPVSDPDRAGHYQSLQAEVQLLREDLEGAIEQFAVALRYRPADHQMRARRAALLLCAGRLDEAEQEARYAARLQPRNYQYRNLLQAIATARDPASSSAPH